MALEQVPANLPQKDTGKKTLALPMCLQQQQVRCVGSDGFVLQGAGKIPFLLIQGVSVSLLLAQLSPRPNSSSEGLGPHCLPRAMVHVLCRLTGPFGHP